MYLHSLLDVDGHFSSHDNKAALPSSRSEMLGIWLQRGLRMEAVLSGAKGEQELCLDGDVVKSCETDSREFSTRKSITALGQRILDQASVKNQQSMTQSRRTTTCTFPVVTHRETEEKAENGTCGEWVQTTV